MKRIGFDQEIYLKVQTEQILERVRKFDKLYLEVGGKLADDLHASRVLPGFDPRSKLKVLSGLKNQLEIIVCVSAIDLERNKIRDDYGITYAEETIRLIRLFQAEKLMIKNAVITLFDGQAVVEGFKKELQTLGLTVHIHRRTTGYPSDIDQIVSDAGYGQNSFIKTSRPIVVVTAPGPSSGKMATCLSQMYHEFRRGRVTGYAKYETFPVWDLDIKNPVNVAYEAATLDLMDVNLIDPYHLAAYGKIAVNYNRDVNAFPVLKQIIDKITGGEIVYQSPTDMGVNMVSRGIVDQSIVNQAANQEVVRRYFKIKSDYQQGRASESMLDRSAFLMNELELDPTDRLVVPVANERLERLNTVRPYETNSVVAIELGDGQIVTGKNSSNLTSLSAAIINCLKVLAKIDDRIHLLDPKLLAPIRNFKIKKLGLPSVALSLEEILLVLNISAVTEKSAKTALEKIDSLRGCRAHAIGMLSSADEQICKRLEIDLTTEIL